MDHGALASFRWLGRHDLLRMSGFSLTGSPGSQTMAAKWGTGVFFRRRGGYHGRRADARGVSTMSKM